MKLFGLIVVVYLLMSVVTLCAYALDKRAAAKGRARTPESRLHLYELMGGWPGGLVGQRVLRHKNRKAAYQVVFWGIVALHAAGWAGWWWLGR